MRGICEKISKQWRDYFLKKDLAPPPLPENEMVTPLLVNNVCHFDSVECTGFISPHDIGEILLTSA